MTHLDDDDNDQDERGGMVVAAWLLIAMWALFGLLLAWLCSGDSEGVAWWIRFVQAYFCYVWISVALAAVLMLALGEEQR